MSRVLLIFTIFTTILFALGAPIPETVELEKRITHFGRGTWFHVGKGNCGKYNVDSDLIVAIPKSLYDRNGGSNCDQYIRITNTATGRTVYGLTRDSCPSCGSGDLDLSPSLFSKLAPLSQGVIQKLSWNFMARGWHP
ncbi:Papain inhibitor [Leucoagaricus sp. SymC.cos]|nr:Papain inhibitor [Leucoagaricus sp. SymC.cos]